MSNGSRKYVQLSLKNPSVAPGERTRSVGARSLLKSHQPVVQHTHSIQITQGKVQ